ncbi:HEXXH motif-containing putative peptide modification protein [Lysinibacillus sp. NPDC056959]|uniref:aKG-HExxH-type peptide beta-hydroxylase n=1 Tax=Lysinibacillus sp. NPDC056959 TaxID=3345981 RepID=UPI00363C5092
MRETIQIKSNLSVLNKQNIYDNIESLLEYFYQGQDDLSQREKYITTLNQLQNNSLSIVKEKIYIDFSNEKLLLFLLEKNLISKEDMILSQNASIKEKKEIENNIIYALDLIKSLNPSLYNLVTKIVGIIFVSKAGNFSSATAPTHLGIVFLNPDDTWTIIDYAEAIYHEFIHLSIFLEDMIHGLFVDTNDEQLDMPEITSILRGVQRPLDRSFHAAVVSIGIMHLHYMLDDVEKSKMYMEDLRENIIEMNRNEMFFERRGRNLLINMNLFVENRDFQSINYYLEN